MIYGDINIFISGFIKRLRIFSEDRASYSIGFRVWFYIGFLCFPQANSALGSEAREAWAKLPLDEKTKWANLARLKNEEVRLEKEEVKTRNCKPF